MRKIQQDVTKMLTQDQVTIREMARFVGKAVATVCAFPLAPLHYRVLQFRINAVPPAPYQQGNLASWYNTKVRLDEQSRADLRWWTLLDRKIIESPIWQP